MEELRNLLIFLMSDGCGYITGDTISIDGGHHLAAPSTFAGLAKLSPADWQRAREAYAGVGAAGEAGAVDLTALRRQSIRPRRPLAAGQPRGDADGFGNINHEL